MGLVKLCRDIIHFILNSDTRHQYFFLQTVFHTPFVIKIFKIFQILDGYFNKTTSVPNIYI